VRLGGASQGGGKAQRGHAVVHRGQGFGKPGNRYQASALQLGSDFYRTNTDRAGAFVSMGGSDFGNKLRVDGRKFDAPNVAGAGFGLYYNHNNPAGWYADGAVQISRLEGRFNQMATVHARDAAGNHALDRRFTEEAKASGTSFAVQGEMGYRYAFSSGMSVTPKLRLDHHNIQLGATRVSKELGKTSFNSISKTGIYYGVRLAQDWDSNRGKVRVWAEPGVSHALGAKAKYAHTTYMEARRVASQHDLNATRLGLQAGIEGNITKHQSLRLQGGMARAFGKNKGTSSNLMASWNMGF
jgi:autotransporter family porin